MHKVQKVKKYLLIKNIAFLFGCLEIETLN